MKEIGQNGDLVFTIDDVCHSSGLTIVQITEYIQEGLFDVRRTESHEWQFSETHLVMIKKVARLEQDLRLNPAGAVLALELMSKIDDLEQRLRRASFDAEQG